MANGIKAFLLFCLTTGSLVAGVPSNAVVLTNPTGSSVNQPITISRVFTDGEICHYPKPVGISQWQADVKTHWASGCVQHAMISFWPGAIADTATSTITFTDSVNPCHLGGQAACNAAALDQSGILAFNSASWGAAIQVTPRGLSPHQSSAVQMIADGNFRYWLRGPIVTQVIAEDKTTSRAYDFSYTCTNCLSFTLDGTSVNTTTNTFTVASHNLASGTKVTIPWSGTLPGGVDYTKQYYVVNATTNTFQLSLTNGGAAIDLTSTGSGTMTAYPSSMSDWTWTPDNTNRNLHPMFIVTMYPGWAGVKVDYILENAATAEQEQDYQLSLLSGRALDTTKFLFSDNAANTYTPHYIRSRWRKTYWDGTALATLKVDLGLDYLQYSKIIPPIDPNLTASSSTSTISGVSTHGSNGAVPFNCDYAYANGQNCVNWNMYFPSVGGRQDIGIHPGWYVDYLRLFDPAMLSAILAMADVAGLAPYHLREYNATKYYDEAHTTLAFGRPISVDARPTWAPVGGVSISGADQTAFTGPYIFSGWTVDDAHHPDMTTLPYLLTGDFFYLEELQFMAAYQITNSNSAGTNNLCRNYNWGVLNNGQIRAWAWKFRTVGNAALFSPDGTPEKAYFKQKLDYSIAVEEGILGIKDGNYYDANCLTSTVNTFTPSTNNTKWCWGRLILGTLADATNPLHLTFPGTQTPTAGHTELDGTDWTTCGQLDYTDSANWNTAYSTGCRAFYGVSPWMVHFNYQVWGYLTDLEFNTKALARYAAKDLVSKAADSNFSPIYNIAQYHEPSLQLAAPSALAASITNTSKTLTVTSPVPAYANTPGMLISIENEIARVCSASGFTITICNTGRSPFGYPAYAHPAGAPVIFLMPFTSLESMRSAFQTPSPSTWSPAGWYADIALSALALLEPYDPQGLAAYTAAASAVGVPRTYNAFPWKMRRDPVRNVSVDAGDTFAIVRYTAPTGGQADSACTVDGADDGQSYTRARSFVKTGLSAGTAYTSIISCAADPYDSGAGTGKTTVNYETVSILSGAGTFTAKLGGAGTTAHLDYGATPATPNTASAACAGGCTISVPASRGLLYYRVRRDGAAAGAVNSAVVR